jgi:hypothetical protein
MVPALKSSDHTIKCACGNCDAVLLLHAEDAQAIATTPQKQLLMPSKTPRPIVERLHTEMKRIMAAPDMREKIAAVGLIPNDSSSIEEMRGYIASEHVKWGALVKQFGSRGLAIGPGGRGGFAVSAAQGAAAATGQDAVAGLERQPSVTGGLCKLLQQCRKTFRKGLFF